MNEPHEPLPPRLGDAVGELRRATAAAADLIDVRAAVLGKVRRKRGVLLGLRRVAPLAAAALVLLVVGQELLYARSLHLSAPGGARVYAAGRWVELQGEHALEAPMRLATSEAGAELRARGLSARLDGHSELEVRDARHLRLTRGGLSVVAEREIHLGLPAAELIGQGRLRLALATGDQMKKLRLAATLMAGAAVLFTLREGYVRLGEGAAVERLEAPAAALIDGQGQVHPLPSREVEAALRDTTYAVLPRSNEGGAMAAGPRTGASWDEAARTIRFAIAGEVFDAQTGVPIERFETELSPEVVRSFAAPQGQTRREVHAPEGQFRLEGLGLGRWQLVVRAKGYAPSRQVIGLDAVTSDPYVVVPLSQGGQVSGVVSDWRGEPVAGAKVRLGSCGEPACAVETDRGGRFLLSGAPEAAPFTVHASHARHGIAELPNVTLQVGETRHLELRLSGVLRVFGRVVRGAAGEPAPGVTVQAGEVSTATDAEGRYDLLTALSHRPQVRVVLPGPVAPVELASYPRSRSAEPIQWVEAETHVAELEKDFLVDMEDAALVGRISRGDGSPVAHTRLRLRNTIGFSRRAHQTFPEGTATDAEGRYRVDHLPAFAGYELAIEADDGWRELGMVVVDQPREVRADFVLGGAGSLRGRFVDRDSGAPFPLAAEHCRRFGAASRRDAAIYLAHCLDDGGFELTALPPGPYRLGVIAPKSPQDFDIEPVDVEVGTTLGTDEVLVRLSGKRLLDFTVRVTDESGRFVSGLVLRYHLGTRASRTSTLSVREDGTAILAIPEGQAEVFIDAAGYAPARLEPATLAAGVNQVRLRRSP